MCRILIMKWKCEHQRRVTDNCWRSFVVSRPCPNKANWPEADRSSKYNCPYCVTKLKAEKKARKLGINVDVSEPEDLPNEQ